MGSGDQSVSERFGIGGGNVLMGALAVRTGEVTAAVPEPQTYALALMGLSAMVLAHRRQRR